MRINIEDLVLDGGLEAVHDGKDHDQDEDAQEHDQYREERVGGHDTLALFRFKVAKPYE